MPVRYGVVGCGAIAQRRHIPECVHNPNSSLVALCDPNAQRVDEISKAYGGVAKCYTDYAEMLKDPNVDAVVVSGPNSMHASQSIQALEAGKHVLCEKPMATTREDAKAMMAAAKKSGKFLMIALNQRLIPAHKRAKEILDSGRLGKVLSFRTAFQHPGPESWSVDGGTSWFFQKGRAFMGVTGDLSPHRPQAEALRRVIGRLADAAVIKDDAFGPAAFEEEFTVVGAIGRGAQGRKGGGFIEMGFEGAEGGVRHRGLVECW